MAVELLGVKELTDKLKKLDGLSKKTAAKMVAAAGGVIRKEAKSIAQSKGLRKTGSLIKNIAIKRERNVPANTVQYNVGVRHGREFGKRKNVVKYLAVSKRGRVVEKFKDDPFYWKFLEFGHKTVARGVGQAKYRKLALRGRGRATNIAVRRRSPLTFVAARPFIGPAFERKRVDAVRMMETVFDKEILKGNL